MALDETARDEFRSQIEAYGGVVVKTQGDSFMVAFSAARGAILCAIAIQRIVAQAFRVEKGNHRHFMAKEIAEQPVVLGDAQKLRQVLDNLVRNAIEASAGAFVRPKVRTSGSTSVRDRR